MRVKQRTHTNRQSVPCKIMSATSAAAAGSDQYPRLSSLGTRRARRNIPTVASHRKEVKKEERRRGGGERKEAAERGRKAEGFCESAVIALRRRLLLRLFPPSSLHRSSSLENLCPAEEERPRGESRGRDTGEYRVGGWPEERKREHCARTLMCALSRRG